MYLAAVAAAPSEWLLWTPNGAVDIIARVTFGDLIVGALLVVGVAVGIWAWWSSKVDPWLDGF